MNSADSPAEEERLELPVEVDFDARPPRLDPQVMLRRSAEHLKWRNSLPRAREQRLGSPVPIEFVLRD